MDLKQLRSFIRVAEAGSLSRASDRLRLAQPALSRQIKLLEAEIGLDLFIRHGRGMRLTEAGQEFLDRVAGLLRQIEQAVEDVRSLESSAAGMVALGMTPTLSYALAARLACRVAAELPAVSLRIVEGYGGHLVEWLQRGDIDMGLFYGPGADFHLRFLELFYEELVLVGSRESNLDPDIPVPVPQLVDSRLVLPSRPHGLRAVVDSATTRAKITLNVQYEADSLRVLKALVEAGFGYTVLPKSSIRREEDDGSFKTAPLVHPRIMRQIVLALPPNRTETRATLAVINLLLHEVMSMVRSGELRAVIGNGLKNVV